MTGGTVEKAAGGSKLKAATSGASRRAAGKQAAGAPPRSGSTRGAKTEAGTTAKKAESKKAVAKKSSASKNAKTTKPKVKIPEGADYLTDQKWLEGQRAALDEQRAKYTHSADRLAAEAAALMADREPGDVQFDEESGEGDTIAVERDRDLALSAAARQAVEEIDAALARLDEGTYGICVVSGEAVPRERLEAIPEASVCVQYKTSMF